MGTQLRLEGEAFEPTRTPTSVFGALLKDYYVPDMMAELRRTPVLLFAKPPYEVLPLFKYVTCLEWAEVGEENLYCHMTPGHSGPHYDGHRELWWRTK